MSEYIYREIYLTENRRIEPIATAENNKMPIVLKVMDKTLTGSKAEAYSYNSKDGEYKTNTKGTDTGCTVANNTVTINPRGGLFLAGHDKLQVHFHVSGGSYITRVYDVSCDPDFSAGGATPEAEAVKTLIRQAEQARDDARQAATEAEQAAQREVPGAVAQWMDAHPEDRALIDDNSITQKKLAIGTLGYVTPEMFGAKGDGITDDSNSIQQAITYASNCGCNVIFTGSRKYCVANTIFIPNAVTIIGNYCKIIAIGGGTFTKSYMFSINSSDIETWDDVSPHTPTTIKQFDFSNDREYINVKLFFAAGPIEIEDIRVRSFYQTLYMPAYYIDIRYLKRVLIADHLGDNYAIRFGGGGGDDVVFDGVHIVAYSNNGKRKLLDASFLRQPFFHNCLNGYYRLEHCSSAKFVAMHIEKGGIELVDTMASIENSYFWKTPGESVIVIKDTQAAYSGYRNYPVDFRNSRIVYTHVHNDYSNDNAQDIYAKEYYGRITINNVFRDVEFSNNSLHNRDALCGISVETNKIIKCVANPCTILRRSITPYNILTTLHDSSIFGFAESSVHEWQCESGNYTYKAISISDTERRIRNYTGSVVTKTFSLNTNGKCVGINQYNSITGRPVMLRIYRTNNTTGKVQTVDIPCVQSNWLIDIGTSVQGYRWVDAADDSGEYQSYWDICYKTNNMECFGNAAPTNGTWVTGDKVYAANPSVCLGWVCTSAGTPGTWKEFGTIS